MIVTRLSGGLGNQIFQYAFGRYLSEKLGTDLKFDVSDPTLSIHHGFELKRIFNIKAEIASPKEITGITGVERFSVVRKLNKVIGFIPLSRSKLVEEMRFNYSEEMLTVSDNTLIVGYWQSEKYFIGITEILKQELSFKIPMNQMNVEVASKIINSNSVALHVRRNDFASNAKIRAVHGLCTSEYYKAAIKLIDQRVECPTYFIFSDDISWARENLCIDHPCRFIQHNKGQESFNDMRLMSLCKHNIIANSSFSWWGAWLNSKENKIVIAPKSWFATDKKNTDDLIPGTWIKL